MTLPSLSCAPTCHTASQAPRSFHPAATSVQGRTILVTASNMADLTGAVLSTFKSFHDSLPTEDSLQLFSVIPTQLTSKVLGGGGASIRALAFKHNVQLHFGCEQIASERLLESSGSIHALETFISALLSLLHADLWYDTGVDYVEEFAHGKRKRQVRCSELREQSQHNAKKSQGHAKLSPTLRVTLKQGRRSRFSGRIG